MTFIMKKYLFIVLLVGFCSGQYLSQKCQYDNKPLTKSFVGDTRKIEYGKWYTKYSCTGIKQHEYWIPDAQPNYSQGGAEALGYGCGVLLGALLVKAITDNSVKNENQKEKNSQHDWIKDAYSKKNKNQKSKGSKKQTYKRPLRYKDMTPEGKQEYIRGCIVSFWVVALMIQVVT